MRISYNWLSDYLPVRLTVDELSQILTSIGLEVENVVDYEEVKGSLKGLVVGEILDCQPHPNADKLKLTSIDIGLAAPLQIVCGASNVVIGNKAVVATVDTTIYGVGGNAITIRKAKIRSVDSEGMLCASDEIGIGEDHTGIIVLPKDLKPGTPVADFFQPYQDYIVEIGLTPNHMDAMSHIGVARDVCSYLSHHRGTSVHVKMPASGPENESKVNDSVSIRIENTKACPRYSGLSIDNIRVGDSPKWMKDRLKAVGVRPINNIVDISNYVLQEFGQPLHAYDADKIHGNVVVVGNVKQDTNFEGLDGKIRVLSSADLIISDNKAPMCIAGVFGGLDSGVAESTQRIFLESAWFDPLTIRKTSIRLGLRTDAATHFEKGMDISGTVAALKRAAMLIGQFAGGRMASSVIDQYPHPRNKKEVTLRYDYLTKLSGKTYSAASVKLILTALGFEISSDERDSISVRAPFHKPDIELPADLVEEIMRIDGYDNITIPVTINISPSVDVGITKTLYKEKISNYLAASGFSEIFTNSITNSAYFGSDQLEHSVKMINSLTAELNIMRPSLLQSGLESVAYNLNRKNTDLKFFEFGKTYSTHAVGNYEERDHLCLYITGKVDADSWQSKSKTSDLYYLKGICSAVCQLLQIPNTEHVNGTATGLETVVDVQFEGRRILQAGMVNANNLAIFDIRQPVYFADFDWTVLADLAATHKIEFREISKHLAVHRDLAIVVDKTVQFAAVEQTLKKNWPGKLKDIKLFDIFESEKIGANKKSLAISFDFMDPDKTLTDRETDSMMAGIIRAFESEIGAEIRK